MSVTRCAGCGSVTPSADWAAHWDTPTGARVAAWSCSDACADEVERMRGEDGRLIVPL